MKNTVYRNLHRKCWSVMERGLVVEHRDTLVLGNCIFRVRPSGRARVLKEKKKFVHAFAVGNRLHGMIPMPNDCIQITYNPYKADHFYRVDTNEPVYGVGLAFLMEDGKVWARPSDVITTIRK